MEVIQGDTGHTGGLRSFRGIQVIQEGDYHILLEVCSQGLLELSLPAYPFLK